jgi:hypothetical protein
MMHNVLYALLGFTSEYVEEVKEEKIVIDVVTYSTFRVKSGITHWCDAEIEQINKIVPLGWYHNFFRGYIEQYDLSWTKMNEDGIEIYKLALISAIRDLIHDYFDDVTTLEDALNEQDLLPISNFIHQLQKVFFNFFNFFFKRLIIG